MVKREINICDICKDRIANKKCDICGKDTCGGCRNSKPINMGSEHLTLIITCRDCYNLNKKMIESLDLSKNKELIKSIKTPILNHLKKIAILNNLGNLE